MFVPDSAWRLSTYSPSYSSTWPQHTTRTFHNLQGQVESRDSGLWINSFDFTGIQHITPHVPEINDSVRTRCREDQPFCGYPWFLPVKFLSKSAPFPHRVHLFHVVNCMCTLSFSGVFAGRTGTFLLQKCLPALRWSSACCPKRRPAGGLSKWPSVWQVRSALCCQNSTIPHSVTVCGVHSEIRDKTLQLSCSVWLDLSHVSCAEDSSLHVHRLSRQSWLGMLSEVYNPRRIFFISCYSWSWEDEKAHCSVAAVKLLIISGNSSSAEGVRLVVVRMLMFKFLRSLRTHQLFKVGLKNWKKGSRNVNNPSKNPLQRNVNFSAAIFARPGFGFHI